MTKRIEALDGIRGYAALSVALGHSLLAVTGLALWSTDLHNFPAMSGSEIGLRLLSVVMPSDAAVMVFFVLSGHVLWHSFARKNLSASGFIAYLRARIQRLYPLIIITTVTIGIVKHAALMSIISTALLWTVSVNGVLWSLQVEVIGSVVIVLIWFAAGRSQKRLALALLGTAVIVPLARGTPLVFMPAFVLGALINTVPDGIWRRKSIPLFGLCLLLSTNIIFGHGGITRIFEMAGATCLVGGMGRAPVGVLLNPVARFLGAISYPFYLSHPLGAIFAAAILARIHDHLSSITKIAVFALISIGIAMPLAWILHITIEHPMIDRRRRQTA
ncbi:MAG: acyltransferase [Acidocella sp.]|nr:acyltransferase [Acidocella sp.]